MNKNLLLYLQTLIAGALILMFIDSMYELPIIQNALIFITIVSCIFSVCHAPTMSVPKVEKEHKNRVVVWDRTSIDIPSLSILAKNKYRALYVCSNTEEYINFELIKSVGKISTINHWKFETSNVIDLKVNLILTLYDISKSYGKEVTIDVFTTDRDLTIRMEMQGLGYGFSSMNFHESGDL
jgi:hypothetical protein